MRSRSPETRREHFFPEIIGRDLERPRFPYDLHSVKVETEIFFKRPSLNIYNTRMQVSSRLFKDQI